MLSIIPGIYMSLKAINEIKTILPLSYLCVCIFNLFHYRYPDNVKLLKYTMISHNLACAIHSLHLYNFKLPFYLIYILSNISISFNLNNRKELYASYILNAIIIVLASPYNNVIFTNWIKFFLLFVLSRKHPCYLFEIFLNLLCHSNIYLIWKTI